MGKNHATKTNAEQTGSVTGCRVDDSDQAESLKKAHHLFHLGPRRQGPHLGPHLSCLHLRSFLNLLR